MDKIIPVDLFFSFLFIEGRGQVPPMKKVLGVEKQIHWDDFIPMARDHWDDVIPVSHNFIPVVPVCTKGLT